MKAWPAGSWLAQAVSFTPMRKYKRASIVLLYAAPPLFRGSQHYSERSEPREVRQDASPNFLFSLLNITFYLISKNFRPFFYMTPIRRLGIVHHQGNSLWRAHQRVPLEQSQPGIRPRHEGRATAGGLARLASRRGLAGHEARTVSDSRVLARSRRRPITERRVRA